MSDLVGQTFAGYEILAKLGEGGMGSVFKARQPMLNRLVALKVMASQLGSDPSFVARFIREASAAANLNHPNMVQVYTAGESDKVYYIAMEFVEGESLRIRLDRLGRIPPQEAIAVTVYIAQALQYAWNKARLIHRDIKPDNIFLSNSGEVKVGDLGLAKSVGSETTELTQTGTAMGSPHYISPEQAQGAKDIDFRADIYSLGCTLYHMLTGKTPYSGDSSMAVIMKHVHDPPPAIFKVWPTCPMPLGMLVGRMLAKQRHERHQSYEDLIADLMQVHERLRQTESVALVAATPAPVPDTVPKVKQTGAAVTTQAKLGNRKLVYAAGGVCAAVALAGVLWWAPWKKPAASSAESEASSAVVSRQVESIPTQPAKGGIPTDATPIAESRVTRSVSPVTIADDAAWQSAINLLPLVDVGQDAVRGRWQKQGNELNVQPEPDVRLQFPYAPPEEYDFRIEFTVLQGSPDVAQLVTGGGRDFAWKMGHAREGPNMFGFEIVKGHLVMIAGNPTRTILPWKLELGRRHTSIVRLRKDGVTGIVNDQTVTKWNTDYGDMSRNSEWKLHEAGLLGVGGYRCAITFHRAEVIEVSGKGRLIRPASSAEPPVSSAPAPPPSSSVATGQTTDALKLLGNVYTNAVGAEMVAVPPGEFMMGSTKEEQRWAVAGGANANAVKQEGEAPRKTRIQDGFWLGRTEVTMAQWKEFIAATEYRTDAEKNGYAEHAPRSGQPTWGRVNGLSWRDPGFGEPPRDNHPVCCVSWNDAVAFCAWLTERERKAGRLASSHVVRLPTEAEWEYACRGGLPVGRQGTQGKFWWGESKEDGKDRLNWFGTADGFEFTSPVDSYGERGRNAFGLADMLGNVQEWCLDDYDAKQAHEERCQGWPGARVVRGGAFDLDTAYCRCAYRHGVSPSLSASCGGFRVAVGLDFLGSITSAVPVARPVSLVTLLDGAFIKEVAALPAEQQVARVVTKLKEINPGFDGRETHKVEGGAVTELTLSTMGVTDIAPVKALKWLKKLTIAPWAVNQKGSLSDLSALKELPLSWLYCQNNPINDLSPLKGLPLTVLGCGGTQVNDLSPLAGIKLTVLSVNDTAVSDLSPLSGMPLTVLWCNNTKVTDFAPLKRLPLQELRCDFQPQRDAEVLRGIPTLQKINDQTAAVLLRQFAAAAQASRTAATGGDIRVLIVTGVDLPSHDWRATGPAIQDELQKDLRMKVEILNDIYRLDSTDLTKFQVVLLNFYTRGKPDPNEQARDNLKNFVNRGGGLVIFHSTCGSFRDWPEFRDLAGKIMGQGKYDKFGPMRVKIANANHPITRGMQAYETTDELYAFLEGRKPVEVLATAHAKSTGSDEPMAFVLTYGKGRVFHIVLGHAVESIHTLGTAKLIRRGTAWVAGCEPVLPAETRRP